MPLGEAVASRICAASRAHARHPQADQVIAKDRGFAGGDHQLGVGQGQAHCAQHLHELGIGHPRLGLEILVDAALQPGKTDANAALPESPCQIPPVKGQQVGFQSPVRETQQRADTKAAEARLPACLDGIQTIPVASLRSCRVIAGITSRIVDLLIERQPIDPAAGQSAIVRDRERLDLDGDGCELRAQAGNDLQKVGHRDRPRILTADKQNVPETLRVKEVGFQQRFLARKRDARDFEIGREAAIRAVIDARVGKVERGVQLDHLTEATLGHGHTELRKPLELGGRRGREERRQVPLGPPFGGQCADHVRLRAGRNPFSDRPQIHSRH